MVFRLSFLSFSFCCSDWPSLGLLAVKKLSRKRHRDALSFSLNFLSIFVHISGSIRPITLIWASLERSFPSAEVEYGRCQFWSRVMTSEVEERPRLVTAGYGWHRTQWVNRYFPHKFTKLILTYPTRLPGQYDDHTSKWERVPLLFHPHFTKRFYWKTGNL